MTLLLLQKIFYHRHQKIPCLQIELDGNIFNVFLYSVIEMYQKLQEDLECIEELYKEF